MARRVSFGLVKGKFRGFHSLPCTVIEYPDKLLLSFRPGFKTMLANYMLCTRSKDSKAHLEVCPGSKQGVHQKVFGFVYSAFTDVAEAFKGANIVKFVDDTMQSTGPNKPSVMVGLTRLVSFWNPSTQQANHEEDPSHVLWERVQTEMASLNRKNQSLNASYRTKKVSWQQEASIGEFGDFLCKTCPTSKWTARLVEDKHEHSGQGVGRKPVRTSIVLGTSVHVVQANKASPGDGVESLEYKLSLEFRPQYGNHTDVTLERAAALRLAQEPGWNKIVFDVEGEEEMSRLIGESAVKTGDTAGDTTESDSDGGVEPANKEDNGVNVHFWEYLIKVEKVSSDRTLRKRKFEDF